MKHSALLAASIVLLSALCWRRSRRHLRRLPRRRCRPVGRASRTLRAVDEPAAEGRQVRRHQRHRGARRTVAYQREFGFADLETKTPLKPDTIYRVYSMSKPITGVAVMMLLEEGRFVLDDPVSRFIPCYKDLQVFASETPSGISTVKADREMTIRDLLRHTSGLTS